MRKQKYILIVLLAVTFLSMGDVYAQATSKPFFTVEGEVLRPLNLTLDELSKLKQTEVKAKDKDNKEHVYKGVRLVDVLDSAGVTLGKQLRGENLVKYILIRAADGYEVVFSLPEVDPEFTSQTILLAYAEDGKPLPKGEGPFRMIVPNDKRPARWIRDDPLLTIAESVVNGLILPHDYESKEESYRQDTEGAERTKGNDIDCRRWCKNAFCIGYRRQ